MIDKFIELVRQYADDDIVRNPAVPDQYNDEAIREVGNQIFSGLQGQVNNGNVEPLAALFREGTVSPAAGNPLVSSIVASVAAGFASKFGIPQATARQVAAGIVPKVLNNLVTKTNDPKDRSFELPAMLKQFSGNDHIGDLLSRFGNSGPSGGVAGMLGKVFK